MSAQLSPIVSEFETQERADSYDHWRSTLTSITLDGFLASARLWHTRTTSWSTALRWTASRL